MGLLCSSSCAQDSDLGELLERPEAARQCDERIGEVGHLGLALVQRLDDPQTGEPRMRKLAIDEALRDHPDHLTAGGEGRVRERSHEPDATAAVHHPDATLGQTLADGAGRIDVARLVPGTRTAEDADAHPVRTHARSGKESSARAARAR